MCPPGPNARLVNVYLPRHAEEFAAALIYNVVLVTVILLGGMCISKKMYVYNIYVISIYVGQTVYVFVEQQRWINDMNRN